LAIGEDEDFTVAQAADLLGISRTAVEKRQDLPEVPGSRPRKLQRAGVLAAHEAALREARAHLAHLIVARVQFGLPVDELLAAHLIDSQPVGNDRRRTATEAPGTEKTGRALAEAAIDRLSADLRRAYSAIDDLKVDLDVDLDRPPT